MKWILFYLRVYLSRLAEKIYDSEYNPIIAEKIVFFYQKRQSFFDKKISYQELEEIGENLFLEKDFTRFDNKEWLSATIGRELRQAKRISDE